MNLAASTLTGVPTPLPDLYKVLGAPMVLVEAGGKRPLGGWTANTSDLRELAQWRANSPSTNVGVVAGPTAHGQHLLIIDADTPTARSAFATWWSANVGGEVPPATVETPGKAAADGSMVHHHGAHWYVVTDGDPRLSVLGDVLTLVPAPSRDRSGDAVHLKVAESIAVCPPSIRAEGAYRLVAQPSYVPAHVLVPALQSTKRAVTPAGIAPEQSDSELDWAAATPWSELVLADGWTEDGRDQQCGCATYRHPNAANARSAVAHECDGYTYGDGPLILYTDTRAGCAILEWADRSGGRAVSKLSAYAAIHHSRDEFPLRAAKTALGITDPVGDMSGFILGTATPVVPTAPGAPAVGDRAATARTALADLLADDPLTSGSRSLMAELGIGTVRVPTPVPVQTAPEPSPVQVQPETTLAKPETTLAKPETTDSPYRVEHHPVVGDPDAPTTVLVRDDMPSTERPTTGPFAKRGPLLDVYLDYSPPPASTLAPGGFSGWADPYTCPDGSVSQHVEPLKPGRGMYLNGEFVPAPKPAPRTPGVASCCAYHEPVISPSASRSDTWAMYTETYFPESSMCDQMHVNDALRAVGFTVEKDRLWQVLRDQGPTPELTDGARDLLDRLGDMTERAHNLLGSDVLRRGTQRRYLARKVASEQHMLSVWSELATDHEAESRYYAWKVAQRGMWIAAAHADVQSKGLGAAWSAIEPRITRWAREATDYIAQHPDEAPIQLAPMTPAA